MFGVQCKRRSVDVARLNGIFMMVANKSGRERERVARKRATSRAELNVAVAVAVSVKARSVVRVCAR